MTDSLTLQRLTVDGLERPLGHSPRPPAFGWVVSGHGHDVRQRAYRIVVTDGDATVWDSGTTGSARSVYVPYAGPPLRSRALLDWTASVWIEGRNEPLVATSSWETGIGADDWVARWITWVEPDTVTEPPFLASYPSPYLRSEFVLPAPPVRGRAYATALGLYELRVNGTRSGAQLLTPGWTDYHRRLAVQTYDITPSVREGVNAVAVVLADGWYAGRVGFFGRWQYGDHPALLLQLEIECVDGSHVVVATDNTWRASNGPIVQADIIDGIVEDRRLAQPGWDLPGFDDAAWRPARHRGGTGAELVCASEGGVEVIETIEPTGITRRDGVTIVDFGQNIAGRVTLAPPGEGGTVVIRHGEMLDADGGLYTENLRSAAQRDEWIVSAGDGDRLAPPFTYHGFRYAEVAGVADVEAAEVRAEVMSSALHQTGTFSCSDPLLGRLQANIVWGQRGNFVSVPTDCPQRDERLGWTGDALCFVGTASFNYDTLPFFRKWLADLDDAQLPSGAYPDIAPRISWSGAGNSGWAEAGVLVPWTLYVRYGDERVLADRYDGMRRFMRFLEEDSTEHIRDAGRYGDWVSLGAHTPKELIGTAYLVATADAMAKIASVLDVPADAEAFAETARGAREAFARAFVSEDGAVHSGTQTAYALALHHDLVPEELRAAAAANLAADIDRTGHLTTGFLGTPIALPVLTSTGYHELACRLAQRTEYPSWGFSIEHGATTIWERWDGWTSDAGFKEPRMNSFNHYSLGAVGDWLYRHVAGLEPNERAPGYGHVFVRPKPGGTLTSAAVRYDSVRGPFASGWSIADGTFTLNVTIPANATATIELPYGSEVHEVGSGTYRFKTAVAS